MKITKILGLALLTASAFTSVNAMTDPTDARFNNKTPYQLKQIASDAINAAAGHVAGPGCLNAPSQSKTYTDSDNVQRKIQLYKELSQTNLILICPNGHLSDIPWSKFLYWKTQKETRQPNAENDGKEYK
jgi:hypothetical protein